MDNIEVTTLFGNKKSIPKNKIEFRPGAYGIIFHGDKILLTNMKSTGKYVLPGGAIEPGETIKQALRREVYEETGIAIKIKKFVSCEENNFYYDPEDKAWQVFAFIFVCEPKSLALTNANNVPDDESTNPEWIEVSKLSAESFQVFGRKIMQIIERSK